MSTLKKFWRNNFGSSFSFADVILLFFIVGYPIYIYFNAMTDLILINPGFDALLLEIGGWIFGVTLISFFVRGLLKRAKK